MERNDRSRSQVRLIPLRACLSVALAVCLVAVSPVASGQTPPNPPGPTPTPTITGPATFPVYTLGQYALTGDPALKVAWLVMADASQATPSEVKSGQSVAFTAPPGAYKVIAFTVSSGQPVILMQKVTIAGPAPAPTPTPTPTPPPNPTPAPATTGPYTVVLVMDKTSTVPISGGQAALKQSGTMQGSLKALAFGNTWVPNVDINDVTWKDWAPTMRKVGVPCILIVGYDAKGNTFLVEGIANPVDEASVLAEIQRLASGGLPK